MRTVTACKSFAAILGLYLGFAAIDQSPTSTMLVSPAFADDDDDVGGGAAGIGLRGFRGLPFAFPRGARPRRAAREREYVVSGIDATQVQAVRDRGFRVIAERTLSGGRGSLLRLGPPRRTSKQRALASLREIAPGRAVDENTLFAQRFQMQGGRSTPRNIFADPLAAVDWRSLDNCDDIGIIGLVDTGIDTQHAGLASKQLELITQRAPDRQASSTRHGTAVATLLLGDGVFPGLASKSRIIAIDAFHSQSGTDQIDTFDLVSAMDMLVERGVAVINLSLAGAANEVLDTEGLRAQARGVIAVAASGNDGAAAKPRYPAAYPWAIATTAIDKNLAVYKRAVRGPHIRLAAPGVDLALRDSGGKLRQHTGTSFAAPFVAARLALAHLGNHALPANAAAAPRDDLQSVRAAEASVAALVKQAVDLGEPGKDVVYGNGLVQFGPACRSETSSVR